MSGFKDLTGLEIGSWKVVSRALKPSSKNAYWNCICGDCGKEYEVSSPNLLSSNSTRCVSCAHIFMRKPYKEGTVPEVLWNQIIKNAEKRDIPILITSEEAFDKLQKQRFKCALTGADIELPAYYTAECSASLDRIESSLGYTKDNIQWVDKYINFMKGSLNQKVFIHLCNKVAKHRRDVLEEPWEYRQRMAVK